MLSKKFQVNDIVDAVDELFIWWKAKIVSIKDDWTVIVQWKDFGKNTTTEIHVEENIRGQPEKWNIRESAALRNVLPEKRRRTKKEQHDYNPKFLSRCDQVCFLKDGLKTPGWVFKNDSVKSVMEILLEEDYENWHEDHEEIKALNTNYPTLKIPYNDLCAMRVAHQPSSSTNLDDIEDENYCSNDEKEEELTAPKPKKVTFGAKKQAEPVDMSTLVPVSIQP